MKERLLNMFDRVSMEFLGHTYRWLKLQREELRRKESENQLKDRLAVAVVTKLRQDLSAPDDAGW